MTKKLLLLITIFLTSEICFASGWECVDHDILACDTWRWEVPGGWLITVNGTGIMFYPEPEHLWKV